MTMTAAERQRKYRLDHRDEIKQKRSTPEHRLYMKSWIEANRDRVRWSRIKSRYGITRDDFDRMLIRQCGRCAVCGEPLVDTIEIDHDHETGEFRGLLCHDCNTAVGFVETVVNMNKADRLMICEYLGERLIDATPQV